MAAFGTVFMPEMTLATYREDKWSETSFVSSDSLTLHPGAHVLHYSSTCFEGLKAFRHQDDSINIFRLDANVARLKQSSKLLHLPDIDTEQLTLMIIELVRKFAADVPAPPGSMYIRPTHFGTEPSIGKAAGPSAESMLYVLLSQVGDYFSGGTKTLRLLLDETGMRCSPHMGMVKSGGNYASALHPIMAAQNKYQADQVLFCPNGDVQETGAANFILIDGDQLITKALDSTFLHGITRDSILKLAAERGLNVCERELTVSELLERSANPECEAALSGTAAVLTSVGTLIHEGKEYLVGNGQEGPNTKMLRQTLNDIQWGHSEDKFGWLTKV